MGNNGLDQGLENVTVAETRLSSIDGKSGDLVIAGYPVGELATPATFEEAFFLLLNDRLPNSDELKEFRNELAMQREIGEEVERVLKRVADEGKSAMDALRIGAATIGMNQSEKSPEKIARQVVASFPTIVATYYRAKQGQELVSPRKDLGHTRNYLYMLQGSEPSDAAVRGLETYLNTVIDHGVNASTFTARVIVSTESDVVSAATGAVGALKGPLHGGAPGPVFDMLQKAAESGNVEEYIRDKLEAGERLMGFGHRVYDVRDPRAKVLEKAADQFYQPPNNTEFIESVQDFEETAVNLLSEYQPDHKLQTNVEFYTAVLLNGVGIPQELFPATFGVSRVGGWMAHCLEQLAKNRLIRPRARYVGETGRTWTPLEER